MGRALKAGRCFNRLFFSHVHIPEVGGALLPSEIICSITYIKSLHIIIQGQPVPLKQIVAACRRRNIKRSLNSIKRFHPTVLYAVTTRYGCSETSF
jgi:hypothetical protein